MSSLRRVRDDDNGSAGSKGSNGTRSRGKSGPGRYNSDPGGIHPYGRSLKERWPERQPLGTGEKLPPGSPQRGVKASLRSDQGSIGSQGSRGRGRRPRFGEDETESDLDEFAHFLQELFAGNIPQNYRGGRLKQYGLGRPRAGTAPAATGGGRGRRGRHTDRDEYSDDDSHHRRRP